MIALVTIILLLYAASRSWFRTLIVLVTVPFSVAGAIWFLWLRGYNWSGVVIVGLIALAGFGGRHRHAFISGISRQQLRGVQGRRADEHRPGLAVVVARPATQNGEGVHE